MTEPAVAAPFKGLARFRSGSPSQQQESARKRVRNFTANDRAAHRMFEKSRREAFKSRLTELAGLLPTLAGLDNRRLSKHVVVDGSISRHRLQHRRCKAALAGVRALMQERDNLLAEVNQWRANAQPRQVSVTGPGPGPGPGPSPGTVVAMSPREPIVTESSFADLLDDEQESAALMAAEGGEGPGEAAAAPSSRATGRQPGGNGAGVKIPLERSAASSCVTGQGVPGSREGGRQESGGALDTVGAFDHGNSGLQGLQHYHLGHHSLRDPNFPPIVPSQSGQSDQSDHPDHPDHHPVPSFHGRSLKEPSNHGLYRPFSPRGMGPGYFGFLGQQRHDAVHPAHQPRHGPAAPSGLRTDDMTNGNNHGHNTAIASVAELRSSGQPPGQQPAGLSVGGRRDTHGLSMSANPGTQGIYLGQLAPHTSYMGHISWP